MPLPKEDFKVFLSHSEEDDILIDRIYETLCRLHIRTFVYEYYQRAGQNRFETIKDMIRGTPYFIALLTSKGLQSQWVNQEIGYAVGVGKTPIPILETDPGTGERLKSRGFVELHDPILFSPENLGGMIYDLIYTFYSWLNADRSWPDMIWLTCKCGNEFDGQLDYENMIAHCKDPSVLWECRKCGNPLEVGFPGFELHFL